MNRLTELRKKAAISQTSLGILSGVSPGAINRYERGVRPNKATAIKIAKTLEVEPAVLFPDFDSFRAF